MIQKHVRTPEVVLCKMNKCVRLCSVSRSGIAFKQIKSNDQLNPFKVCFLWVVSLLLQHEFTDTRQFIWGSFQLLNLQPVSTNYKWGCALSFQQIIVKLGKMLSDLVKVSKVKLLFWAKTSFLQCQISVRVKVTQGAVHETLCRNWISCKVLKVTRHQKIIQLCSLRDRKSNLITGTLFVKSRWQ